MSAEEKMSIDDRRKDLSKMKKRNQQANRHVFAFRDVYPAPIHVSCDACGFEARQHQNSARPSALWAMRESTATCSYETSRRAGARVCRTRLYLKVHNRQPRLLREIINRLVIS